MAPSGHGGDIRRISEAAGVSSDRILDFSANINPLGPPPWLGRVIESSLKDVVHYPDLDSYGLIEAASRFFNILPDNIIAGNGSTEQLFYLPRVLDVDRAVILSPAYIDYATASRLSGIEVETLLLQAENGFAIDWSKLEGLLGPGCVTFLGQPNNPTGRIIDPERIREAARAFPDTFFIIDEAFAQFVDGYESLIPSRPDNVIVLHSLTKFYAIPGLRLGLAYATEPIIGKLREQIPPWSVNVLSQAVGEAALKDVEYAEKTRKALKTLRGDLIGKLERIPGFNIFPGDANFLLIRIDHPEWDGPTLRSRLIEQGIAIRVCDNFTGLDKRYIRIAVRTEAENERLAQAIESVLGHGR